jgi:hypothetical protein
VPVRGVGVGVGVGDTRIITWTPALSHGAA